MRLKRLTISNFRGISHLEIPLSETSRTTVIVGINGAGKSSVLEAIALALMHAAHPSTTTNILQPEDIRAGQSEVRVQALADEISITGERRQTEWEVQARIPDPHGFVYEESVWKTPKSTTPTPRTVLAYYPVERMVPRERSPVLQGKTVGAGDLGIRAESVDYASFFQWYEDREDLENEQIREQPTYRDPELEAVRRAVEALLPGFRGLRVRRARAQTGERVGHSRFIVTKDEQTLEIGQLSHGERGLLAMAGDIARRLASVGSASVDPQLGSGIVLIDEIDLHLHPKWQREIIPRLESAFCNVQFIVTTHSPQVLSQLHPEAILILDKFTRVAQTPHTYGRDTNAILNDIMGIEERPRFAAEQLQAIANLMDTERWDEARKAVDVLAQDFGDSDGEVLRLRTMIDVLSPAGDART